eukprot:TRINITY_DN60618_c0_g1_i1.p1 TRINITY_DN60618_c0_g1~~TRINITY_DN60618_c0_g1_i1.p1  ORF type:complete len:689 (+),score=153.46 TRINITY_DN60618_c0_g1_i1:49-2115(+)
MAEKDAAGGDKAGEKKKEGEGKTWTCVTSIFDLKIDGPAKVKKELPNYLEEAILGLRHGPGDPRRTKLKGADSDSDRPHSRNQKSGPAQRVEMLRELFKTEFAVSTFTSLFWLVVGAIFDTLPAMTLDSIRSELGHHWHLFCLEVERRNKADVETRDWVLASIPFVYTQAFFRSLCDGLNEDRQFFTTYSKNFMNKIALVTHYELTGFQINVDTVRRARKRLFIPRVLESPHTNQSDYLKGQRRQQELESQNSNSGIRALSFGNQDAPPPDEMQLDHVMQGRAANKAPPGGSRLSIVTAASAGRGCVPPELSVDRYADLTAKGISMLDKHLCEIFAAADDGSKEEEPEKQDEVPGSQSHEAHSPNSGSPLDSPLSRAGAPSPFASTSSPTAVDLDSEGDGTDSRPRTTEPTTPNHKSLLRFKRGVRAAGAMAKLHREANVKREEEAKAKRERLARLQNTLSSEALPPELCTKEFNTTWVSPTLKTLYIDQADRGVLHKPRAENFDMKMATFAIPARPLSMPALKSRGELPARSPPDALTVSAASGKDDVSVAGNSSKDTRKNSVQGVGTNMPRNANLSTSGSLPKVGSETLILEPPSSLSNKVILNRLENEARAFQSQSFALYMKDHDVFTGTKKLRFNEKRLKDEEDAYLRKMKGLVGGKPKRLLYPGGDLNRRAMSSPGFRISQQP